jgi:TP901 family phage tail tape measure protein
LDKQRFDIIIGMQTGEITKGVKAANGDLKALKASLKDTLSALPGGKNITNELQAARNQVSLLIKEIDKLQAKGNGKTNLSQFTPRQRATVNAGVEQTKQMVTAAVPSNIIAQQVKAAQQLQSKNITLRYAMYDVGSAAQSASQALLGFAGAVLEAQIAQEKAFSAIEKTQVGNGSPEQIAKNLAKLKNELIALSTEIPLSFSELTKIGMLGAQLGVASKDIASFTEVTAKFSAITGMSAEDAAMGMGKVANLLGLQSDQYQALGSAIAGVGVQAAATEAQIISTAGQIGAIAKAAGLSASDIIGLSSAMASLKIAPEEARGVIQPTFAAMSAAARSFNADLGYGSEKLNVFAEISGMSAKDFSEQWGSRTAEGAGNVWRKFSEGLGKVDTGEALVKLGLDGVRTSKGLTAVAQGFGEMNKQMKIALSEGTKGTFLDASYATVADDLSAKLTMLQNSFEALGAAAAGNSAFTASLKGLVDLMKAVNVGLTNMLNSSGFMSGAAGMAVAVAGIGGALLAVAASASIAFGGFLALKTAMQAAIAEGLITKGTFGGVMASLYGLVPAQRAAAAGFDTMAAGAVAAQGGVAKLIFSVRGLKAALASSGIGLIVVALGFIAEAMINASDSTEGTVVSLNEMRNAAKDAKAEITPLTEEIQAFIDEVLRVPSAATDFQNSMFKLGQAVQKNGNYFGDASQAGRDNLAVFRSTLLAMFLASNGSEQVYANSLLRYVEQLKKIGIYAGEVKNEIEGILSGLNYTIDPAAAKIGGFDAFSEGLNTVTGSAEKAKTALEKLDEILQKIFKKYDSRMGVQEALNSLGESIAKNGKKFGYATGGMRENLNAVKTAIESLKTSSNGNLKVFSTNLVSLRSALVKMGITGGSALQLINDALKSIKTKGKTSAKEIQAIYTAINNGLVVEQAKNIRTISDYVSDLSNVLQSAFENRYGKQSAQDSIASAWNTIKESADAAKKSIEEANLAIDGMKADKNVLEYQLKIALKYGDTLRAGTIRTQLAKTNKDIAAEEEKITAAKEEQNKSLVGNSKAAIDNRAKVRELVQAGNAYLLSLAQTGMASSDLKREAAKLSEEFITQGTELGFAKSELEEYTKAFSGDFTAVINAVPRDITLTVTSDPALNAINEFVTKANDALSTIKMPDLSGDISVGNANAFANSNVGNANNTPKAPTVPKVVQAPVKKLTPAQTISTVINTATSAAAAAKAAANLKPKPSSSEISIYKGYLGKKTTYEAGQGWWMTPAAYEDAKKRVASFIAKYGTGYSIGGSVSGAGTGTSDSIPAMLSNGEYVLKANAVKYYGTDFMNALNQMQVQRPSSSASAGATSSSNVVYLSPEDRQLLRAAADRPIALYTENTKIAQSANAGNVVLARRGTN